LRSGDDVALKLLKSEKKPRDLLDLGSLVGHLTFLIHSTDREINFLRQERQERKLEAEMVVPDHKRRFRSNGLDPEMNK